MRIGSLFSGYGGLDMALDGDLAWYSEIEPAACTVLAAHHPGVPNLGDVKGVDWSQVEPVDVITGGYPCQPFSNAGMRKGKDDPRHLWPYVADAIGALRPRYAVLENVRGHLSLGLADVIGDLAGLGYDAQWGVVRASDAGAAHNRARVFIVAYPNGEGLQGQQFSAAAVGAEGIHERTSNSGCCELAADTDGERHGCGQRPSSLGRVDRSHEASARQRQWAWQEPGAGSIENAANADQWRLRRHGICGGLVGTDPGQRAASAEGRSALTWGQYAPAIERWQSVIGRPAPAPTFQRRERHRLNPVFVEWLMGLPEGWVTGHGLSASAELKMLGNGVVPQQAALALRLLGAA